MNIDIKQITIVYTSAHDDIAMLLEQYYLNKNVLIIHYRLDGTILYDSSTIYKSSLEKSDLVIPILYPIQKADRLYSELRIFYEIAGNLEKEGITNVFPIYIAQPDAESLPENEIRKPQTFFSNQTSFFWSSDIDTESNLTHFDRQITAYFEAQTKQKKHMQSKLDELKESAAQYTVPVISALEKRERNLKTISNVWSILGFVAILVGILLISILFFDSTEMNKESGWLTWLIALFKYLIIISLLIAAARYSFLFSKTYMNESLKNSDRIHAIRFGELYLRLFEQNMKVSDFKEVFQYWNTKGDGYFLSLNSEDFDPKVIEKIANLLNSFSKKNS